jgi:hypothetical protein
MPAKLALAFLPAAKDLALGFPLDRTLANQTVRAIEPSEACRAAKGVSGTADRGLEASAAARIATAMADLFGSGRGSI